MAPKDYVDDVFDNKSNCPICNNGIREEHQFALMQLGEPGSYAILDIEEAVLIDSFLRDEPETCEQPVFPYVEAESSKPPVLVYGVLIPQEGWNPDSWTDELNQMKDYSLGTVHCGQLLLSSFRDFRLYEDRAVYGNHIPCALLMDTVLDLSTERPYGFGHTAFPLYQGLQILDNILNREYLFCLGGMEENFVADGATEWMRYIDETKLMQIALRLF